MSSQGFFGALEQYWTVDEKPRLHRKNTFFEEFRVSNRDALRLGLVVSVLATAMLMMWSIGGLLL